METLSRPLSEHENEEQKNIGKVLQMEGVTENGLPGGYVILNEEEA